MPRSKRLPSNIQRSWANNPLPVVVPPETSNIDFKIVTVKIERRKLIENESSVTNEKIQAYCTNLMDATFEHLGVDRGKYPKCFGACRDFCKYTNVYKTNSWKSWDGLPDFMKLMKKVERLTRDSNLLHCAAARNLMVVIALEQIVLHGRISGRSKISDFMRDFDCYNKAVSAICYYESGNRQNVLTLDQPWDLTAKVQCSPSRMIDQSEVASSENRSPVSRNVITRDAIQVRKEPHLIKIESSPEYEAEPATEQQSAPRIIQQAGINATTQPAPLFPGLIRPHDVRQVDPNTLHQVASHAMPQAAQPAMNQYITPFDHQHTTAIARQAADLREGGREEPMSMSILGHESPAQMENYKQVRRAEVMECLQPLLSRLKYEYWTGNVQNDIMCILTEQNVKVITAEAKGMLGLWAGRVNNGTVLSWLEKAQEDLTVFQWIERNVKPGTMMWYADHINTIFHDIDATIGTVMEPAVRDKLRAQVYALRDVIFAQK
ncbi:hypothetical protein MKX08_007919 [Trichoderma sp. CBMAI-0020]|nr:hypothetical protein MKX08_007919 [Trichoderma sp. CBMAI-0020]